jgi:hypothetical protein
VLTLGFAVIAAWGVIILVSREAESQPEPDKPQEDAQQCLPSR